MFTFVRVEATGNIVGPGHPLRLQSGKTRGQPDRSRDKMDVRRNIEDMSFSAQFSSAETVQSDHQIRSEIFYQISIRVLML
jgi:hypothetical protein